MPQEMDQDQEKNKYHVIIIIIMLSQMIAPNKFIIIFVHQRKEDDENAFNNETSGGEHQPSKAEKRLVMKRYLKNKTLESLLFKGFISRLIVRSRTILQ